MFGIKLDFSKNEYSGIKVDILAYIIILNDLFWKVKRSLVLAYIVCLRKAWYFGKREHLFEYAELLWPENSIFSHNILLLAKISVISAKTSMFLSHFILSRLLVYNVLFFSFSKYTFVCVIWSHKKQGNRSYSIV